MDWFDIVTLWVFRCFFSLYFSQGESLKNPSERDEILREDWKTNSDYELGWPRYSLAQVNCNSCFGIVCSQSTAF